MGQPTRALGFSPLLRSASTKIRIGQSALFRRYQDGSGSQGQSSYVVQDAEPQEDGQPGA